ncbi:MAG TPA: histidinol-phosphatase [Verrucomicrobiales bacterium]|nr:histidinol-phosphatase [Verrucomicrobiales bacterium]
MLGDYHTHTTLCRHAVGTTAEYVSRAAELGLAEMGFSDHAPFPRPLDDWRMTWEEFPVYLERVEEARRIGRELGIAVRLGLECDYITGRESDLDAVEALTDFDYLIGSIHYLRPDWVIDAPDAVGRLSAAGLAGVWQEYWTLYARMVDSGRFDVMGHPDLPKKFGFRPEGDLRHYYLATIAAARRRGIALEINTSGLRKPIGEAYPEPAFLELAQEAGLDLVISSDAHAPEDVGAGFPEAIDLARRAGFTHTTLFEKRRRRSIPLPAAGTWL